MVGTICPSFENVKQATQAYVDLNNYNFYIKTCNIKRMVLNCRRFRNLECPYYVHVIFNKKTKDIKSDLVELGSYLQRTLAKTKDLEVDYKWMVEKL